MSFLRPVKDALKEYEQAMRVATQCAPAPLLIQWTPTQAPRAPPSRRRNVAVLSHAEYVPTLTAAAALRVKAALSKAVR